MASRGRPPKRGTPFDQLIKQQCQKGRFGVGVNKSASMVHGKWGATSFTSMRTVNGINSSKDHSIPQQANTISDSGIGVARKREWTTPDAPQSANNTSTLFTAPRPKKFFKSRDPTSKQEQTPESNLDNISESILHENARSLPSTDMKLTKKLEKGKVVEDGGTDTVVSTSRNKPHKRNKYSKEPSTILMTNQLQQIADGVPPKKTNKKFFTSKQRKQEENADLSRLTSAENLQIDAGEDRENVPRVPPLKLRLKAANAAALSIGSLTNQDDTDSGYNNKTNNNKANNEFAVPSGDMNDIDDTQTQILSDQSDPDNQHNVNAELNLHTQSEQTTDILVPKGTRRGTRKQKKPLLKDKAESAIRKKNGINENCERSQKRDVTDVAGGTRNHRKVLQPTLPSSKDTITTTESKSITSEIGNTRSTRSSRSRGSNRAVVNYNEEKSDEFMDSVCEDRNSQQPVVGLSTISEVLCPPEQAMGNLDLQKEGEDEIPAMQRCSPQVHDPQIQHDSNIHTDNMGQEKANKLQIPDKDWTMEDVDEYYTKVNEEEIKDPLNADLSEQQPIRTKENEIIDKVNSRAYTRKRKQKQIGVLGKQREIKSSENDESSSPDTIQSNKEDPDERIPNQDDITKMAAPTSNPTNEKASKFDNDSMQNSQDISKNPDAFNCTLNTKTSNPFSIKVLADLKEEDDSVEEKTESDNRHGELSHKKLEKNDQVVSTQSTEVLSLQEMKSDEDSDFYSKLMENKNQVTQKNPVKSFSFSSKPSNTQGSTSATSISTAVIKKKSIFKTKAQGNAGTSGGNGNSNQGSGQGLKGRSLYKHKWSANNDENQQEESNFRAKVLQRALTIPSTSTSSLDFDESDFNDGVPSKTEISFSSNRLVRVPTVTGGSGSALGLPGFDETLQEVVSVKCPKAQKTYYQVIKKTKMAHQIQDSGEFQEFNDDVEYIQEGLGIHNNLSTRCLSTVTLASKCMEPPFRMHLRAHGTVTKLFLELKDAPKIPSLALCASTVLFVLSQDRLNMDLDRESLELMLNLLDTDSRIEEALDGAGLSKRELEKNKSKVQELVAAMKAKGRATNLSLDHISADHLAMETLLSMTSKRAGEWFKEELRELGGLDHLVRTMSDCLSFLTADDISIWTEPLHNKLKKSDRVLKVLESVTHENEENCQYLLEFQDSKFLNTIHSFYKLLDEEIPLNSNIYTINGTQAGIEKEDKDSVAYTLRESLLGVIRVYINLVHDYKSVSHGSRLSGQKDGIFGICLHGMFVLPSYLPEEKRFDIVVLTLTLIINLVENCKPNRSIMMKTLIPEKSSDMFTIYDRKKAPEGLIHMFLEREENARRLETKTDKILDGKGDEDEAILTANKNAANSCVKSEQENVKQPDTNFDIEKKKTDAPTSYGSKAKSDSNRNIKNSKTDAGSNSNPQKSHEEFIDETVKKLLEKAGSHMEDTLVASYLALIIGYLIHEDKDHEKIVRQWMPENNFSAMVAVLKKFFNFMNLTASASVTSTRGLKATEMILKYLEKVDEEPKEKTNEELKAGRSSIDMQGETFDDLTIFDVTKDEDEDLDDASHAGSRSDRSRNSESSFLDMKSPNFDDFGKL